MIISKKKKKKKKIIKKKKKKKKTHCILFFFIVFHFYFLLNVKYNSTYFFTVFYFIFNINIKYNFNSDCNIKKSFIFVRKEILILFKLNLHCLYFEDKTFLLLETSIDKYDILIKEQL